MYVKVVARGDEQSENYDPILVVFNVAVFSESNKLVNIVEHLAAKQPDVSFGSWWRPKQS